MEPPHPTPHWPPPPFPRYVHPIWLASYPRSGNTFLRIILQSVFDLPSYSAYNLDA